MFRKASLSVFAVAASGIAATAADLPVRSQIGAIFAEPAEALPPVVVDHYVEIEAPIISYTNLPDPVWNRGNYNYGSSWSWYNPGPYYGGPSYGTGPRLPYVCGLYGYCF